MDKRAFTGSLLSQLAGRFAGSPQAAGYSTPGGAAPPPAPAASGMPVAPGAPAPQAHPWVWPAPSAQVPPAPPASPAERRVLVVSDLPGREAISVLQEAYALRRFGFRVEAMIPADAMSALARYAQPGTLLDAGAPPAGEIWGGLDTVLAVPSQDLLSRLALGLQDRPSAWLVLQALWRGIPVWMDFSCTVQSGGAACANPALAAFYEGYAAQLRALGVRPVAPGEYLITLRGHGDMPEVLASGEAGSKPSNPEGALPPAVGHRAVITQQDLLRQMPSGGVWAVPPGALVTPLARDTAKKLGVELRTQDP